MNRNALCAMGIAALLVILAGCASTGKVVSDEDLLDALKQKCVERISEKDIEGLLAFYAEDFYCEPIGDKEKTRAFLEDAKSMGFLDDVEFNFSNATTVIEGDKATTDPVEISGYFGYITATFHAEKRDGVWLITRMEAVL